MRPKRSLILFLSQSWNDWKLKLFAPCASRLGFRTLISASFYLLLLLVVCEEYLRVKDAYYDTFRSVARQPKSLLERRRLSGCAFNHDVPGWDELLNYISRRIPDSEKILFLPLGPDAPDSTAEQNSAYCFLIFELFPRPIIRIYPGKKDPVNREYLVSGAESTRARYLILYRGSKNYNPPFAHCRFGEDLYLVDVKNEMSCKYDDH